MAFLLAPVESDPASNLCSSYLSQKKVITSSDYHLLNNLRSEPKYMLSQRTSRFLDLHLPELITGTQSQQQI
jgi:hypothetical protein